MDISIVSPDHSDQAALLREAILSRILCGFSDGGMKIALDIDPSLPAEGFRIDKDGDGWLITGADGRGLYYGVGKFLHSADWTSDGFSPKETGGVLSPACSFRAIYFAVHFYNWYQNAPDEELEKYLSELMLWGCNTAFAILPVINCSDPDDELFIRSAEKVRRLYSLAKKLGMDTGIILGINQGSKNAPDDLLADPSFDPYGRRGTAGKNVCLSKPGGLDYMESVWRAELERFTDIGIDSVITWPYDEGGCGCENCRPWGANGYLKGIKRLKEVIGEYYPSCRLIISTWLLDTPENEGEYEGLYKKLKAEPDFADMLMTDAHDAFPAFPLENVPPVPMVNFPEISMWKLFPWGGFGANPMPERFDGFWKSSKRILSGGMPYSEGIYEDISKVQCFGYYWDPDRDWRDTLREYFSYELCADAAEDAIELCRCIERNHVAVGEEREPDPGDAKKAGELSRKIDAVLPERAKTSWRWRILYIRGILDEKRYGYYFSHKCSGKDDLWLLRHFSGSYLARDPEAQSLFEELFEIYHCVKFNGENRWTLPPIKGRIAMKSFVG
ncbi:MAG: hypothetical protein IJV00_08730 [Clostridia bacterium]|nr:hypothetical protein [Clostridia bacterium]